MGKGKAPSRKTGNRLAFVRKAVFRSPNTTRLEIMVKRLGEAQGDKRFVLKDGRMLKDVVELARALEHMSDDTFNHHVNSSKNDFANWIKDVFGEKELAVEIEKAKNRGEAQLHLLKHAVKMMYGF